MRPEDWNWLEALSQRLSWQGSEDWSDEHNRLALYRSALDRLPIRDSGDLLDLIGKDADHVMAEAVLAEAIDKVATTLSSLGEFDQWLHDVWEPDVAFTFPRRRAEEWRLYMRIQEDPAMDPAELQESSDWLQRRVATNSESHAALAWLAQHGRTKRTRAAAAESLRRRR